MKKFLFCLFGALVALSGYSYEAKASIVGGASFTKVVYLSSAISSTKSPHNDGRDYASAKGFYDGNLVAIPKNVVITNVYVIVDEAVSGISLFRLGDADSATGFVSSSSPTFSLDTMYFHEVDYKGAYLKGGQLLTASALGKYYSVSTKYLVLDVTGTATAGKMRVFMEGYAVGAQ